MDDKLKIDLATEADVPLILQFIRELGGVLGFGNGLTLKLDGLLSSENMTSLQKRLYTPEGTQAVKGFGPAGPPTGSP